MRCHNWRLGVLRPPQLTGMQLPFTLLLALLASQSTFAATPTKRYYSTYDYYVLEHHPGAGASVVECAKALGVELVEQAGELQNLWVIRTEKRDMLSRGTSGTDHVLNKFKSLQARAASNRYSFFSRRSTESHNARRVVSSVKYLSRQMLRKRTKRDDSFLDGRAPPPIVEEPAKAGPEASAKSIALRLDIRDPLFTEQWHLVNDEYPQHMMNATPVWDMGLTGEGVISALVDDGLDYRSDDLAENFVGRTPKYLMIPTNSLVYRMLLAHTISMTTSTCPPQCFSMIITGPAVLGKSLPKKIISVVLGSPISRKLPDFGSSLEPLPI